MELLTPGDVITFISFDVDKERTRSDERNCVKRAREMNKLDANLAAVIAQSAQFQCECVN